MQVQEPNTARKPGAIKKWAKSDRPREKLITKGSEALTDTELLGVLIGKGTSRRNAIELARFILEENHNDLHSLARRSVRDLLKQKLEGFGGRFQRAQVLERLSGSLRRGDIEVHHQRFALVRDPGRPQVVPQLRRRRGGYAYARIVQDAVPFSRSQTACGPAGR